MTFCCASCSSSFSLCSPAGSGSGSLVCSFIWCFAFFFFLFHFDFAIPLLFFLSFFFFSFLSFFSYSFSYLLHSVRQLIYVTFNFLFCFIVAITSIIIFLISLSLLLFPLSHCFYCLPATISSSIYLSNPIHHSLHPLAFLPPLPPSFLFLRVWERGGERRREKLLPLSPWRTYEPPSNAGTPRI